MHHHRYILQHYKGPQTRHRCPICHKPKTFTVYIDTETNEPIAPNVGRCNREINCGYHYTPKQYFSDNNIKPRHVPLWRGRKGEEQITLPPKVGQAFISLQRETALPAAASTIPNTILKQSLNNYNNNNLVKFLFNLFGEKVTGNLIEKYLIGTSTYWDGATVFWQIDKESRIRTGKIILYDAITGKRNKQVTPPIYWAHKELRQDNFELRQCFFGEHLLKTDPSKPVAIVESEKTAIIASVYQPGFNWLAAGSLTNLNENMLKVLKGRTITLFPDLNAFDKWTVKANELSGNLKFIVSKTLEDIATAEERQNGLDIADYFIRINPKEITTREVETAVSVSKRLVNGNGNREMEHWEKEVDELYTFFDEHPLPNKSTISDNGVHVKGLADCVMLNLYFIRALNGKGNSKVYLDEVRLVRDWVLEGY